MGYIYIYIYHSASVSPCKLPTLILLIISASLPAYDELHGSVSLILGGLWTVLGRSDDASLILMWSFRALNSAIWAWSCERSSAMGTAWSKSLSPDLKGRIMCRIESVLMHI